MIREITMSDIPALFRVRVSVKENLLTMADLESMGITEESVAERLRTSNKGYLWEESGKIVGFSIGDSANGEMWVIAVLPEYEGKGIGKVLLSAVEQFLANEGHSEIWLTTSVPTGLRAYGFYQKNGWRDDVIRDGCRFMKKTFV